MSWSQPFRVWWGQGSGFAGCPLNKKGFWFGANGQVVMAVRLKIYASVTIGNICGTYAHRLLKERMLRLKIEAAT